MAMQSDFYFSCIKDAGWEGTKKSQGQWAATKPAQVSPTKTMLCKPVFACSLRLTGPGVWKSHECPTLHLFKSDTCSFRGTEDVVVELDLHLTASLMVLGETETGFLAHRSQVGLYSQLHVDLGAFSSSSMLKGNALTPWSHDCTRLVCKEIPAHSADPSALIPLQSLHAPPSQPMACPGTLTPSIIPSTYMPLHPNEN